MLISNWTEVRGCAILAEQISKVADDPLEQAPVLLKLNEIAHLFSAFNRRLRFHARFKNSRFDRADILRTNCITVAKQKSTGSSK